MKIYKLDIDASKPIRKVVQMQQNATGALSVDVTNDGKYIRNLSCALYEGGAELSAYATTDSGAGYKIDMGDTTKVVKFTAKSVPTECSAQYVLNKGAGILKTVWLSRFQLNPGAYNQDEFYSVAKQFQGDVAIDTAIWIVRNNTGFQLANIDRVVYTPQNPAKQLWFYGVDGWLNDEESILVYESCDIGRNATVGKSGSIISSYTYPAVGYWTDYSLDTVIRPSENAHCFAEQEVSDPEPEPTPDPDLSSDVEQGE